MTTTAITRRKLAVGSITVLAALLVATVGQGATTAPGPDPPVDANTQARTTQVSTAQAQQFAILRREQDGSDPLTGLATGPYGANLDLARAVDTAAGRVWVVPANGYVCLRVADSTGAAWSCEPTDDVGPRPLLLTLRAADGSLTAAYGVVTDATTDVRAVAGQSSSPVVLSEGVIGEPSPRASALSYRTADGQQAEINLP